MKDCKQCHNWDHSEKCCWTQRGGFCDGSSHWKPEYHVLEEKYKELLKVVEYYATVENWRGEHWGCQIDDDDVSEVDEVFFGGDRARECLKRLEGE